MLLALVLCLAGAACDRDDDDQSLLELRPVVATNPPPCPEKAPEKDELVRPLPSAEGTAGECLRLARAIVSAKDVRSATVAETPSKEPALSVVLGGIGSANLDGFAQRNQGQRLAIVADGTLVSAPVINFPSFYGRIQVSGLSKEKTDDLFRRLNKLIKN